MVVDDVRYGIENWSPVPGSPVDIRVIETPPPALISASNRSALSSVSSPVRLSRDVKNTLEPSSVIPAYSTPVVVPGARS